MRRGVSFGRPRYTPVGVPPKELFFSHIDNHTKIKSLGVLLASTGTPPVALATPIKGFPIANAKESTRQTIPPESPRHESPYIRAALPVYRFLTDKVLYADYYLVDR